MIKPNEIICIYHGNCADGFGAAWSVRHALGDEVTFFPGVYQQEPPDVTGKYVVLVDFSYKPEVLLKMLETALGVLVLDHHKSAMESCKSFSWLGRCIDMSEWAKRIDFARYQQNLYIDRCENAGSRVYTYFDMDRSGAMLAWSFFNSEEPCPILIKHIQDRDLWTFKLPKTRQVQAALFSYPYDFEVWDDLMYSIEALANDGEAIERKHFKDINEFIAKARRRMVIAGHDVPALNANYMWSSDAGHILAKGEKFAACYWDEDKKRVFSLRSADDGFDVSEIAAKFGGGGHKHAAGFSVLHGVDVSQQPETVA